MLTLKHVALPYLILMLLPMEAVASDLLLTATELRTRVVGNTVVGIDNGNYYEEYLQPNGVILGRDRQAAYRGWWRIEGNKLCFAYEQDDNDDNSRSWDCSTVGVTGDRVTWNDDGTRARLVPGRGLSNLRLPVPGPQAMQKQN